MFDPLGFVPAPPWLIRNSSDHPPGADGCGVYVAVYVCHCPSSVTSVFNALTHPPVSLLTVGNSCSQHSGTSVPPCALTSMLTVEPAATSAHCAAESPM